MATKTVETYIDGLEGWKADAVSRLCELVRQAAPEAEEAIKWSQPVYSSNGPAVFIKAFKNHINFGFWRGVQLDDPEGLLSGSGEKMRHVKVTGLDDIQDEPFQAFVRAAIQLNGEHGDPTKSKA